MKICLLLLTLVLSSIGLFAAEQETLEDVLRLHTEAIGGKAAIEKVQSVEFHLTIQEPEFTVHAVYVADRNIRMRIDVYAGEKRVFTEAYDGRNGWQMGEDGNAKDASPEGTAALRNGIYFPGKVFGLYELPSFGHRVDYVGRETIENISYYVLKLTMNPGKEVFFYIHPETGLIEKMRDVKALHIDIDPTVKQMETTNSEFRKVDGVMRSFKSVQKDLKTGKIVQTTTISEIKINPKLEDTFFQKPS